MVLTGLVLAVISATGSGGGIKLGERIAVIPIDGVIGDDKKVLDEIREFRDDASIKGYVVAINSPGGSVGPSQSIYSEIKRIRQEDKKPVIAAISSVGASGGYYVALAADSIYANPGSITGSIGVIMELPNVEPLMKKVGVEWQVVKSAEHKDIGSPFRQMTPGDRDLLNAMVQDVYGQFVDVVSKERRLNRADVLQLADGRVLSGRQAQQSKLIDRLGNFNDAVAAAGRMAGIGKRPKLVYPTEKKPTLFDVLLGRAAVSTISTIMRPIEDAASTPRVKFQVPL